MWIFIVLCVLSAFLVPLLSLYFRNLNGRRDPKWTDMPQTKAFCWPFRRSKLDDMVLAVPAFILIVSGFGTLAAWCSQAADVQAHEYYGKMQVLNVADTGPNLNLNQFTYQYNCRQESYSCTQNGKSKTCHREVCSTGYYEAYRGLLDLGWGGSWGCPDHKQSDGGFKVCEKQLDYDDCSFKVCNARTHNGGECSSEERTAAREKVENCLSTAYPGAGGVEGAITDKVDTTETFDASQDPGKATGVNAYSIDFMYGDCDVCSAKFSVPIAAAKRNRIAGFIVLWVGCTVWGIYLLRNGLSGFCCRFNSEMPYPAFKRPPERLKKWIEMEEQGKSGYQSRV